MIDLTYKNVAGMQSPATTTQTPFTGIGSIQNTIPTAPAVTTPVYGYNPIAPPQIHYNPSLFLQQQLARAGQQFNNPMTAPRGWNNAPPLAILPKLNYGQQATALSNGGLLGK